jgi:hemerythrin-like domain-containing protein
LETKNINYDRRKFLQQSFVVGAVTGITGLSLFSSCKDNDPEEKVSPAEDLMREHGVLNRIMLVYDACRTKLSNGEKFPLETLTTSAKIIRTFIEDYHEKLEELFLFPRFEKANQLTELVTVLRQQHTQGRLLTEQITIIAASKTISSGDIQKMIKLLSDFNRMYRPHEAREDTILFPALKKIVSSNEYDALGEDFEKKERELFGTDGFETMVERVANVEKQLGIYDLSEFTPAS